MLLSLIHIYCAKGDGQDSHKGQENRTDEGNLADNFPNKVGSGFSRPNTGNRSVVFADIVGNFNGVILDRNIKVVESNNQQEVDDSINCCIDVYKRQGYNSTAFSEALNAALESTDITTKASSFAQAEQVLLDDCVVVPLYYQTSSYAMGEDVTDISFSPFSGQIHFKYARKPG